MDDLDTFEINRERAIDYLNTRDNIYVFDGYAGVSSPKFFLRGFPLLTINASCSGTPSTESKSESFAPERIMPSS